MWSQTLARCPHSTHVGFSRKNKARSLRQRVLLYLGSRFTRSPGLRCVLCHGLRLLLLGIVAIDVSPVACQHVQLLADFLAHGCVIVVGVQHAPSFVS